MASSTICLCKNLLRNATLVRRRFPIVSGARCSTIPIKFDSMVMHDSSSRSIRMIAARSIHTSASYWKKKPPKKAEPAQEEESEDEDEEADEDASDPDHDLARDYRLVDCPISSLRLDALAKVALGIPRTSVDQLMTEGKIRVDGQISRKKAAQIDNGTMIDLLLDASADNPDFSLVRRVIVHKIGDKTDNQGRLLVTVKKWNQLTVSDYKVGTSGDKE